MDRAHRSPYWPVLAHPQLRRLFPGLALSYLGDGMSVLAVVLLAQDIAPSPAWVGIAVAAYTLPGAVGALALGRVLSGCSGAQLAGWDATLRAVALGAIPITYVMNGLGIGLYVGLLAASSLLHSWGSAGRYTLLADLLPPKDHLAGNAVLSVIGELGVIAGPVLAALLLSVTDPAGVLALDAVTFAVLSLSYHRLRPALPAASAPAPKASYSAGFSVIARNRTLLGLLGLSASFFFLFGPVYVALPALTAGPDGSGSLLATYYTAFGIAAVLGGLGTGYLKPHSLWPTTVSVVLVVGLALLPLGLGAPPPVSVPAFALAGLAWAPYGSMSMALYQRTVPAARLPPVLAANSAVGLLAVPLGTVLGGFLVSGWGERATLLFSALGLIAVAGIAVMLLGLRRDLPWRKNSLMVESLED